MKFKQIISRLTGFSVPVFGVSWNPPELEIEMAKRIIVYLEDRRVLYNPSSLEIPDHCVKSIIEIRQFLTSELSKAKTKSELSSSLRAMRTACRKFLDRVMDPKGEIVRCGIDRGHFASWIFLPALGELRGVFGIYLAKISISYGLDIEDELSSILPEKESKENRT